MFASRHRLSFITLLLLAAGTVRTTQGAVPPSEPWMTADGSTSELEIHPSIEKPLRKHLAQERKTGPTLTHGQVVFAKPNGDVIHSRVRWKWSDELTIEYYDGAGLRLVQLLATVEGGDHTPKGRVFQETLIRDYLLRDGFSPVPPTTDLTASLNEAGLTQAIVEQKAEGTTLTVASSKGRSRFLLWDGWCHSGPITHVASGEGWAALGVWVGTMEITDIWEGDTPAPPKACIPYLEVFILDLSGDQPAVRLRGKPRKRLDKTTEPSSP